MMRNCYQCGRLDPTHGNYCQWCVNKAVIEARNASKGIGRVRMAHVLSDAVDRLPASPTVNRPPPVVPRVGSPFAAQNETGYWLGLDDLARDSLALSQMIDPSFDVIVGVARSGMTPANIVSTLLHKPVVALRQTLGDLVEVGNGWRLGGHSHVAADGKAKAVVIDDTVMTGNSFAHVGPMVRERFSEVTFAALYVNPKARVKPDIWVRDLPWPHILEWNVFNSVLSPNCALDFDGILCDDCPPDMDDDGDRYIEFIRNARPKYLPRKCPVPLVVTARLEKYRSETEAWLRRHGVKVYNLVMHPAKTLKERRRDNIAAFKASHYVKWLSTYRPRPRPAIFFESEDWQAREISRLSGRVAVCPASRAVYGDCRR